MIYVRTFVLLLITSCVFCADCASAVVFICVVFFFQAEDGIRVLVRSRGLGDVYKRQPADCPQPPRALPQQQRQGNLRRQQELEVGRSVRALSLIHI